MSDMTLTVRFRDGSVAVGMFPNVGWHPVHMSHPVPMDDRPVSIEYVQFSNDRGALIGWSPADVLAAVAKERDELKAQLAQALNNAKELANV